MTPGTQYTLITDCYSGRKELYAKKGTAVTIIRVSGDAVIVEANGKRFSTNVNNLRKPL